MTGPTDLAPLQARWPDTNTYPTTPLMVEMLVVVYLVSAVAYITYGLRMYTRITSKQLGLEDWLMTAAMVFSIPLVSLQYFYYKYDYIGVDPEAVGFIDADAEICYYFVTWLNQALYTPILGLIKASSLVFVLRIAGHMRNVRRSIHVINAINIAFTVSQCAGLLLIRIPLASYWDSSIMIQHLLDDGAFMTATSTLTVTTDFLVLSVPFWVFIKTQLPRATKCGVLMIFMASGLVTVIGIARLCLFTAAYYDDEAPTFTVTWGPSLNTLETSLAIMTASLPTLSPLLRAWFPRLFRNMRRGGGGGGGGANEHQRRRYYNSQSGSGGAKDRAVQMTDFSHRHNARTVSESTTESQEGIFKHAGIRKTTDIRVAYSNRSLTDQHAGETGMAGGASSPALSDPALVV